MRSLNYLFPEDKKALRRAYQELRFQRTSLFLAMAAVLFSLLIWGTSQVLQVRIDQLEKDIASRQQTELIQQTTAAENKVREFNALVKYIEEESESTLPLSERIARISNSIPEGIQIDQLNVIIEAKQLTLSGNADNRDSYLALRDALTATGWFEEVSLPITDLLSRENIRFSLQTTLTDSFFTQP